MCNKRVTKPLEPKVAVRAPPSPTLPYMSGAVGIS